MTNKLNAKAEAENGTIELKITRQICFYGKSAFQASTT